MPKATALVQPRDMSPTHVPGRLHTLHSTALHCPLHDPAMPGRSAATPQHPTTQSTPAPFWDLRGGGGVSNPKSPNVCVPTMAPINCPFCKFHFFPL